MKQVLATLSLVFSLSSLVFFTACGDDSSTSVNDDESSSSKTVALSSSSVTLSGASAKSNGSSDGKKVSSSSKKIASSSSGKASSSSWSGAIGSSNSKPSSSSQKSDPGTSSGMTSSSQKAVASSSSEYVPFDHSKTHANASKVGKDAYKQFTDPRNGRSYYYIKIIGKKSSGRKDSVTIMAENLNIGEMVLGKNDQNDDTKIERYCYNNDTTKCDEFGGLYQWAEMMQLPSRCNTESCSDLIQENHQGICPDGWRLMTYGDFYIAWHAETNEYGIKGTRSAYGFGGNNYTGLSLTGAGLRTAEGGFDYLRDVAYWYYPIENKYDYATFASLGYVTTTDYTSNKDEGDVKTFGLSVRCVKLEN
jgi:uncharacterized protein (TIGR02145 family)